MLSLSLRPRTLFLFVFMSFGLLLAAPLHAGCPANLSVSGPDANGIVTVTASTTGQCDGASELDLTLDGTTFAEKTCPGKDCSYSGVLSVSCENARPHTIRLTAKCPNQYTDAQGNPYCDWASDQNSASFTVAPKPAVSLAYSGPDELGHGNAHITYSFPYNRPGFVHLYADGVQQGGGGWQTTPTGTLDIPYNFTCAAPGAHLLEAKAFACSTVSPTMYPSDPDDIATAPQTVTVAGQTNVTSSYDEDLQQLTINTDFPNTDGASERVIMVYVDGGDGSPWSGNPCDSAVHNTCTRSLSLSCGTDHQIRVTAQACARSDAMYNAEAPTLHVALVCPTQTACNSCSTSSASGIIPMVSTDSAPTGPDLCVQNPVHIGSGDVSVSLPLFTLNHPVLPLPFKLMFHSSKPSFANTITYPFGPGWTHPYNQSVRQVGVNRLELYTPAGDRLYFDKASDTLWLAARPAFITDRITKDGSMYVLSYLNGGKSTFDVTTGRWLSTNDRWGNTMSGTYDGSGNLTSVTAADGRQITFEYSSGVVSRVVLPDTTAWQFQYTVLGGSSVLTAIFDPIQPTQAWRTFAYIAQNDGVYRSLTEVRDSAAKLLESHAYDSSTYNRGLNASVEGGGEHYQIDYDTPAQGKSRVTVTLDNGVTQVTDYTLALIKSAYVATQVDGICTSCGAVTESQTLTYDSVGHVLSSTDAGGHITRYTYDGYGNVLIKTEAAGTPRERGTTYFYEYSSWPNFVTKITQPSATGNGLKTTQYQWNVGETVLTSTVSGKLTSDLGSATSYVLITTFDSKHRLIADDGPRTDVSDVTTRTFYSDTDADVNRRGRLQQITTATGLVTMFDDYDVYGNARKITDPNGVVTQARTDLRGRGTATTNKAVSGDANEAVDYTSTSTYDARDRVSESVSPRGMKTRYIYEDGTNRLTDITRLDASDNETERKHFTLNFVGRKTKEEDQSCTAPAATCGSWVTKRSQSFIYDNKNRLVEIDQPIPAGAKIVYAYDSDGRVVSVQDENHATANTTYAYDELSRLSTVTQTLSPGSAITRYAYDAQDNLTSVTDPNGNVTTYAYDDFGRMQSQVSPVTGTTAYSYDPAGNLTSSTDANGATTARTYDASNRVLSAVASRTSVATETTTWTYDDATSGNYGRGRVASMSDPSGSTSYGYDRRGLLASDSKSIQGSLYSMSYRYDAGGNRTRITHPSGRVVDYTFDFADRPSSAISGATTLISSAAYAPFGPITQMLYGNGTSKTMLYDARYRPRENRLAGASGTIADYTYAYDSVGNITQIHDAVSSSYNRDFTYDDLNRLTGASSGASLWGSASYSYDAMGNLLSQQIGGTSTTFTYAGTTPKLSSATQAGVPRAVAYDSAGNEATVGSSTYTYTSRNSLAAADGFTYTYDGRGVRTITTAAAIALDSLSITPTTITAGTSASGTVTLTSAAPTGAAIVTLTSTDPAATPPSTVTVPAGATSATFTITTAPVFDTTVVTISAQYGTMRTLAMTVQPGQAPLASVSVSPSSIPGPLPATGTVTLSAAAPSGGVTINLSSASPGVANVPATVVVAAGQTTAAFVVRTRAVSTPTSAVISAQYGDTTRTTTLTVNPCSLSTVAPPANFPSGDVVWMEDSVPAGATLHNAWLWDSAQMASGTQSHVDATIAAAHEHWFDNATDRLNVSARETLFVYVLVDPCNPPREIMIGWGDSSWEHRAYWGDNIFPYGTPGTGRVRFGDIPQSAQWVRLEVPVTLMGLAGSSIQGMAFSVWGGRAWFDRAGKGSCTTPSAAVPEFPAGDTVWFDDAVPAGATPSASWQWDTTQTASGTQSVLLTGTGTTEASFSGATQTLNPGTNDQLFTYVMLDPCDPPKEVMLKWHDEWSWDHRAFWGANLMSGGFAVGPLPKTGTWIRLQVPAKLANQLEGHTLDGMTLSIYDGKAWYDRGGKASCSTGTPPPPTFEANEVVWFDDAVPAGAVVGDDWHWDTAQKASGTQSNTHDPHFDKNDHYFDGATATLTLDTRDDLFVYALIDPCNPTREIALDWGDGSWEHRAYWGEDLINEQTPGTGRFYIGPLPPAGQWTKLRVPAAFIGLAGRTISGMAFDTYGGKVWFDRAGKTVGGTASLLRRKPNEPQYALLRNFGVDRFGRRLLAMWDFDNDSADRGRSSLPMTSNDAGSQLRRYSLYTPELKLLVETELTSNATPATQYEYAWFAGQPVAQFSGSTTYWSFNDHLGTPVLQTDSTGAVVWRAEYEPYGDVYKQRVATNTHQPLRFPGQEAEQLDAGVNGATDRRYNIFRWYRAGWGRYTQRDPLEWTGQEYVYAGENPIANTDALGLFDAGSAAKQIVRQAINACEEEASSAWGGPVLGALLLLLHADDANPVEFENQRKNCKACKKNCRPCIPPVGTRAYREDTNPRSPSHRGVPPPHWKLYEMHQNPYNCRCFWVAIDDNKGGFGASPPPPGTVPITPAAGGGEW